MSHLLESKVIKVNELLAISDLTIPVYQRPYRWTEENIVDLLADLYYQTKRLGHRKNAIVNLDNAYRLGTVVMHRNEAGRLDVVDGQQRSLTLMLILRAAKQGKFAELCGDFPLAAIQLPRCSETQKNLGRNYAVIKRHVDSPEFTVDVLDFLLNHCEVVWVILHELSEAFQFFDSQNSRGLDLSPHDLLKAFHLREFPECENNRKMSVVDYWEQQNTTSLQLLFSHYLYPVRRWSLGQPAMYFSKANVSVFKGVNLSRDAYPFHQGLNVIHSTVDSYNQHPHRELDGQRMIYPFQLTQTIINGRRFFDWVAHYQALIKPLLDNAIHEKDNNWLKLALYGQPGSPALSANNKCRPTALTIMQVLDNKKEGYPYEGRWRSGDKYVRRMFDSLVLCYYDRFGNKELERAIEYIFIWAYSLRLMNHSVYLQSIEKHIRERNLFLRLQQSLSPVDFLHKPLPPVKEDPERNLSKVEGIRKLFMELGYLSEKAGEQ